MPWFKVDDSFHSHPKVLATDPAALGLWVLAGTWSSANLTDGFVPDHVIPRLLPDPAKQARALVTAGLWTRTKNGYQFHDWTDYNPTSEEVRTLRRKRAEAGRKGGEQNRKQVLKQNESKREASASGLLQPPSRPVPSRSVVTSSRRLTKATRELDDDDLDRIADATRGDHDHAARVASDVLSRANGDVRDPTGYVLRAIGAEPDRYRSSRPTADECPDHPGKPRATCPGCAADRKAAR